MGFGPVGLEEDVQGVLVDVPQECSLAQVYVAMRVEMDALRIVESLMGTGVEAVPGPGGLVGRELSYGPAPEGNLALGDGLPLALQEWLLVRHGDLDAEDLAGQAEASGHVQELWLEVLQPAVAMQVVDGDL